MHILLADGFRVSVSLSETGNLDKQQQQREQATSACHQDPPTVLDQLHLLSKSREDLHGLLVNRAGPLTVTVVLETGSAAASAAREALAVKRLEASDVSGSREEVQRKKEHSEVPPERLGIMLLKVGGGWVRVCLWGGGEGGC